MYDRHPAQSATPTADPLTITRRNCRPGCATSTSSDEIGVLTTKELQITFQ